MLTGTLNSFWNMSFRGRSSLTKYVRLYPFSGLTLPDRLTPTPRTMVQGMPQRVTSSLTMRQIVRNEISLASSTNSMSWMNLMISPRKLLMAMWKWCLATSTPTKYPASGFSPYTLGLRPPEVPIFPSSCRKLSSISSPMSLVIVGTLIPSALLKSAML